MNQPFMGWYNWEGTWKERRASVQLYMAAIRCHSSLMAMSWCKVKVSMSIHGEGKGGGGGFQSFPSYWEGGSNKGQSSVLMRDPHFNNYGQISVLYRGVSNNSFPYSQVSLIYSLDNSSNTYIYRGHYCSGVCHSSTELTCALIMW